MTPPRIFSWMGVSTLTQADSDRASLPGQRQRIEEYVKSISGKLVGIADNFLADADKAPLFTALRGFFADADVLDSEQKLVARASSMCMTWRDEKAVGR